MGFWKFIQPWATTNLVTNQSFEINTAGWTTAGTNTIAQSSAQSKFGAYSLLCTYQDAVNLATYVYTFPAAGTYTLSAWLYVPANWDGADIDIRELNYTASTRTIVTQYTDGTDATATWLRLETETVIDVGDLVGLIAIRTTGAPTAGRTVYVDAVQIESGEYMTTYCDGDQTGCEWLGTPHASTSSRSAMSRAGGRVRDFTDFGLDVTGQYGAGMGPVNNFLDEFSLLPGGEVSGFRAPTRAFTLNARVTGATEVPSDMRAELIKLFAPDAVPATATGPQPIILRWDDPSYVAKEISVTYEGGLEQTWNSRQCRRELTTMRFMASDPFFYQVGQSSQMLDTNDTATLRYIAGRLRDTGQWDDLGLTANPTGGVGQIFVLSWGPDGKLYFGGDFTGLDTVVGRDYIARYDPQTDTMETVGGASAINSDVYAMLWLPSGVLIVGGAFTNAGGDANADYIAQYSVATNTFSAVAAGGVSAVNALALSKTGILYIGGSFVNWGGLGANSAHIVQWTLAGGYAVMATGLSNPVMALAVTSDDTLYIGGQFTADGGATIILNRIATWDGTAYGQVNGDTGVNGMVRTISIDTTGDVIFGGDFTNAGGDANADYITRWNGQAFFTLGEQPANNTVYTTHFAPDGLLYVGGTFTEIGGITITDRLAKWNRSSWAHLDVNLPGAPIVLAIITSRSGPVLVGRYDIWVGYTVSGAAFYDGTASAVTDGTRPARPRCFVNRSGGTSATLYSLRNETLAQELVFDYALEDGETLTVDLSPQAQSIVSSFWGASPGAVLAGYSGGEWKLNAGANDVTCFVDTAGAPTITAYLLWRDTYWSIDD